MSNEEKGMYITALCIQWNKGGVSEDEMGRLSRGMAVPSVMHVKNKFKQCADGSFRNQRLEQERRKQKEFRENRKKSGEIGAKKRWHSHSTAIAQPMASGMAKDSSPSPSPSPLRSTVSECTGGLLPNTSVEVFNRMKQSLMSEFQRAEGDWDMSDDAALSPVSRRPAALDELSELLAYRRDKGRYSVQDLKRLLMNWSENLDKARTNKKYPNGATHQSQPTPPKPVLKVRQL